MFELKLKEMRKAAKLNQVQLGGLVGVSSRVVSSWETGDSAISFYDACLVADALGVTLDELAGRGKKNDHGASAFSADTLRIAQKVEALPWAALGAAEAMVDGLTAAATKSPAAVENIA